MLWIGTVIDVFSDFQYHRELVNDQTWALEFSARVRDLSLKGIDLIGFNDDGKIATFEVFIRPANALMALGEEMKKRLAEKGLLRTLFKSPAEKVLLQKIFDLECPRHFVPKSLAIKAAQMANPFKWRHY